MKKLNLGCGEKHLDGFVNIDWNSLARPDVVQDLNKFPYQFPDSTFDFIEASHIIEHLDKPFDVMKELNRILKKGGVLHVKVPHFSRGFTHAEHTHGFDVTFPLYFNENLSKSAFFGVKFKLQSMRLRWLAFAHLLHSMGYGKVTVSILSFIDKIISFLANLSPAFASRIWCFWVGGFDEIEFYFICDK